MQIKPIRNDGDYRAALKAIDGLMSAKRGSAAGDRLDVLATLVDAYEQKHWPIESPTPAAAIRYCMEQRGLEPADLEPLIGNRSHVYRVLSGRRGISMKVAYRLHTQLGIPAEVLLHPPVPLSRKARKRAS
jgi:HTH-type transcriptional regulator/antitoxin HigA